MAWNFSNSSFSFITMICDRGNERVIIYCARESECKSAAEFYEENNFKCRKEG